MMMMRPRDLGRLTGDSCGSRLAIRHSFPVFPFSPVSLATLTRRGILWPSSPLLFKRLKEGIVKLNDLGRVLMRFNELRETVQLRLPG